MKSHGCEPGYQMWIDKTTIPSARIVLETAYKLKKLSVKHGMRLQLAYDPKIVLPNGQQHIITYKDVYLLPHGKMLYQIVTEYDGYINLVPMCIESEPTCEMTITGFKPSPDADSGLSTQP